MKKAAIVIGHNPRGRGAYSPYLEQYEYEYYRDIADIISKLNDNIDIYSREPNKSYIREMLPVINELNKRDYDFILELHFNSSPEATAKGSECLVYYSSVNARLVAKNFLYELSQAYNMEIRNKSTDGLIKIENSNQRGGFGICKTKDPYILFEPFFGSNEEANKFKDKEKFARFIVDFIKELKI